MELLIPDQEDMLTQRQLLRGNQSTKSMLTKLISFNAFESSPEKTRKTLTVYYGIMACMHVYNTIYVQQLGECQYICPAVLSASSLF